MLNGGSPRTASVVVCAFDHRRWPDLRRAMDSVAGQSRPGDELIVVIDHNPELLARARRELSRARVLGNQHPRGLSGARNTGVEAATGDVIAFIDDDAVAEPAWLNTLLSGYDRPEVAAVGGAVLARWEAGRPDTFPVEFDWVVGCSYRGLPEIRRPVRNLIGANMSFRREILQRAGGFSDGIGRIGGKPVGCEETELCIRVTAADPRAVIVYDPAARVLHRVPRTRATWRYFCARCYSEGLSKALVAEKVGSGPSLASERSYATRTLPRAVLRGLLAPATGDPAGVARAGVIVAGLGITTIGYLAGSARGILAARSRIRGATTIASSSTPRPARPGAAHAASGSAAGPGSGSGSGEEWLFLDVHDRLGIRVRRDAPGVRQLAEMFSPFLAPRLAHHELSVEGTPVQLAGMVAGDGEHRYRPDAIELPGRLQVIKSGQGFQLTGTGELLAPVLALLDALIAGRGAAMVHAAAVARDGLGVCLAAAGGAGKTSATIGLVRGHGFAFMGDDWNFISDDGRILGYAKPLFVRPHHRGLYPQLFADKRQPLAPPWLVRPLGQIATAAHPMISQRPALARVARRWWPEHMIVAPHVALPEVSVQTSAVLAAAVFLELSSGPEITLEPRDPAWMASRLLCDFAAELPRAARELQTLLGAAGLLRLDAVMAEKARILRHALSGRPCFVLRAPEGMRSEDAAVAIAQHVDALMQPPSEAEVAVA